MTNETAIKYIEKFWGDVKEKDINLVLIGAGEFGGEIGSIAKEIEIIYDSVPGVSFKFLGYIDDNPEKWDKKVNHRPVLGGLNWIENVDFPVYFACTIGDPLIRKIVAENAIKIGYIPHSVVAPDFIAREDVKIGKGAIILWKCGFSIGQYIGEHAHIHIGVMVGHKATFGDYSTLSPSTTVMGGVSVGEGCYVGGNTTILQFKDLGDWSIIGAGAVVTKNVPKYQMWVGVPAKKIKDYENLENRQKYKLTK